MDLKEWGWDDAWDKVLDQSESPSRNVARVTSQNRDRWDVQTQSGAAIARIPTAWAGDLFPVVGDWVLLEPGPAPSDPWTIVDVLPRRSRFSRGSAGSGSEEQVLAANVDRVWIVHGLDILPNPRRLERYLAVTWQSGASPEIILTKSDLAEDLDAAIATVASIALGAPIRVIKIGRAHV